MKLNIKTKIEPTIQRKLRLSVSLNKQMNDTSKLADELGVDYHATLVSAVQQFNTELDARLREMKATGEGPTTSGITTSLTTEVDCGLSSEASSVSATKVPYQPPANKTSTTTGTGNSTTNGIQRDRA